MDSIVINLFTVVTPQIETDFHVAAAAIGLIGTIFLVGYMLGTVFGGIYADYVGRRKALGVSVIGYTIFGALTGLASSITILGIFRFLTGLGGGAEYPAGSTYVSESAPTRSRGAWVGIMNSVYGLGIFAAGGIVALVESWQKAFFTIVVFGAVVLILRYIVKESVLYERMEQKIARGELKRSRITIVDLLHSSERAAIIRVSLMWTGYWVTWWGWSMFVPIYLVKYTGLPVSQIGETMALYGFVGFLLQIIAGLLSEALGRRWATTLYSLGGIVLVWIWLGLGRTPAAHWFGALAFGLVLAIPSAMLAYSTEQFPTTIRGSGQAVAIGVGRLISIPMPLVAGLLVSRIGIPLEWKLWLLWPLLIVVGTWLGPETKGLELRESHGASSVRQES